MQKIAGFVAIAALTAALPQLALAQSSSQRQAAQSQVTPGQQASTKNQSSMRQQVKDNLAQAGFTNIRVMPESFLVRATDKDGNPVMMVINPDSVTEITGMNSDQGSAGPQQQQGQAVSKSAKMTDQQANSGAAERSEANQPQSESAKMNAGEPMQDTASGNVPGHQNGMTAELNQEESQGLNLSTSQRSEIWNQLGRKHAEAAPSGFTPQLGETAPDGIQLQAIPGKVSRQVPAVKSYRYATLSNQVLLVDPSSKKIVAIIRE